MLRAVGAAPRWSPDALPRRLVIPAQTRLPRPLAASPISNPRNVGDWD
jgi:hypothetical protein